MRELKATLQQQLEEIEFAHIEEVVTLKTKVEQLTTELDELKSKEVAAQKDAEEEKQDSPAESKDSYVEDLLKRVESAETMLQCKEVGLFVGLIIKCCKRRNLLEAEYSFLLFIQSKNQPFFFLSILKMKTTDGM